MNSQNGNLDWRHQNTEMCHNVWLGQDSHAGRVSMQCKVTKKNHELDSDVLQIEQRKEARILTLNSFNMRYNTEYYQFCVSSRWYFFVS